MQEIRKLLDAEIKAEIEELGNLEAGSQERLKAIEGIEKLCKAKTDHEKMVFEQTKIEYEASEQREEMNLKRDEINLKRTELDLEVAKSKEMKIDRYLRIGVDVAGIVVPVAFYGVWLTRGFEFEEKGTFTSSAFRSLWNCFKPTKR